MKKGQFVTAINDRWKSRPPFEKALEILSVKNRIRCQVRSDRTTQKCGYRLLLQSDIIAVFDDKKIADETAKQAYQTWTLLNNQVIDAEKYRDNEVKQILQSKGEIKK